MSGTPVQVPRSGRPLHGEPTLERAFRGLGASTETGMGLALHTIAARAGLPKSTTSRIASQLTDLGALERLDNGDFVIGLQLLEVASLAPRGHGRRAAALPFMQELHRVTGQHILLTGTGIALLAHAPERIRNEALAGANGAAARVRRLLATVRSDGVCAVTMPNPLRSRPTAMATVAAPILSRRGDAPGALSLVAPDEGGPRTSAVTAPGRASPAIARAARP
ncbi:helix-turn-helix domain-containing protein [Streptomyces sp. NBC_00356]|uniref:helix-turn-helix domain-containing protein n=1 Tax=Streptomyces sp. NBC_00356 TaxID=2975724 RepID=UPI002E264CB3